MPEPEAAAAKGHHGPAISISSDGLTATLRVPAGVASTPHQLRELVTVNAVCVGLRGRALAEAQTASETDREIVIARGKPPIPGQNGRVEYLLDSAASFKRRADGSIDFWEAATIKDVVRGQELARYHPATLGTDGIDVRGQKLETQPGHDLDFTTYCGSGTRIAEQDSRLITATRDGVFHKEKDSSVSVREQVTVEGGVTLKVGNIATDHAVLIKGDVMAGFAVKSEGEVRIDGVIEDARVSAKGDLIVAGGILAGHERIKTHAHLQAKFIHERVVKAHDVSVTSTLRHATVMATGQVHAGSIQGGLITCAGSVTCENLGSPRGDKTIVVIGIDPYQRAVLEAQAIAQARAEIEARGQDPDQVKIDIELPKPPPPPPGIALTITGNLSPPVEVWIGPDLHWRVNSAASNVVLRIANGKIVALPGLSGGRRGSSDEHPIPQDGGSAA